MKFNIPFLKTKTFLVLLFTCTTFVCFSQKKPVDHSVYDSWESIGSKQISASGKWIGYSIAPQAGDTTLLIKSVKNGSTVFSYPHAQKFTITQDEAFVVFSIIPKFSDTRQAKIKKKKAVDMPKDSLGILNLNSKTLEKIPQVKSFALPDKASNVLAYLLEKEKKDTTKTKKTESLQDAAYFFADEKEKSNEAKEGSVLVLKYLATKDSAKFKGVNDYLLSKDGQYLIYSCSGIKKDSSVKPGVYLFETSSKKTTFLTGGKGLYKNFAFDEKTKQIAFTGNKSEEKALVKPHDLYFYNFTTDSASILVSTKTVGMPQNNHVSENGKVFFSKDGSRVFFGTAPIPVAKDTTIVDFEVAKVDIWNYQDEYLQPMQLANLSKKLKESFLAMVDLKNNKFLQLGTEELNTVNLPEDGNEDFALLSSDFGNRVAMQWDGATLRTAYLINLKTGKKTLVSSNTKTEYKFSPKGNHVLWFDEKEQNWFSYSALTNRKIKIIQEKGSVFGDDENDVPDDAKSYNYGGFTEDEKQVLIYDKYDIWSFNPETGIGKNLTNAFGQQNKTTFRYTALDKEKKSVPQKGELLLSAFNQLTKQNGWFTKDIAKPGNPIKLVMENYSFSKPIKAENSKMMVYQKENYQNSPDVYASTNFKNELKLSNINPQQANYKWGNAMLVNWITPKGYKATGVLYKPEDFDPKKSYPMIVYFYEKVSDKLFAYQAPAPTPSRLNISYFVSNGYLVFTPDISYEIGYPGKSAEEFINSGVEYLKQNSWVNGNKIGIQGQSWGGYQVAHLITVTDKYAAAWSGAPVVNMFSAYGGIRWQTGMNRQFQYEKTQSRIGATIWEKPELYTENSPLFRMPNVQTPVVIMANDGDGAVPWYQGIEMFTALRRLGKPVWMLNYNGDEHNLMKRQNRKDISIREQQFFDHYLKGALMPVWMGKGVPATEKGKNWGFDLIKP
ncbi:alpha/beta hydrolase family protein [Pedobacter arcticus]|uniref:alpha/beta hydrolase family protein n=1 Tax=Pedobacter arcticus TaxID=752140 RepID=UPI0002DA772C|nr:prolyl oligopeptidase family serine peptidase [Pedobacter arcticus]